MTRRLLAVAVGVVAGVAVVHLVRIVTDRYAAEGDLPNPLAAARADAQAVFGDLGGLVADVREGMARREAELRVAIGLDSPAPGVTPDEHAAAVRELLDDPAGWRAPRG